MVSERIQGALQGLVASGAVITFPEYGHLQNVLAAAVFEDGPEGELWLHWCPVYPQDQQHNHRHPVSNVTLKNGVVAAKSGIVGPLYIQALNEPNLLPDAVGTWAQWRADLAKGTNQAEFDNFFEYA